MQIKLKTKLTLAFLCVTMVLIALVSLLANIILTNQFQKYAITKQDQKVSAIVALFSSRYSDWNGQWDINGIESIGVNMLSDGLLLRLNDENNAILWDARIHNNGLCNAILTNIAQTMEKQHGNFHGGYVEEQYQIFENNKVVGTIDIGYYGPYFYTAADVTFLNTLNRLLLSAFGISLILSMIIGAVIARQLTNPITRVIAITRNIASGNFAVRIQEQTNTREINELTNSVNGLAETLGEQENLRRQLVSDVAHELRTPISILQSHLEAMIDGTFAADTAHLENIHGESLRVARLVDDLTRLTLLEKGNMVLNYEQFDIALLLKGIAANFQRAFDNKGVVLEMDVQSEPIAADMDKLSQVFINLLTNALKYTNPSGSVKISSTSSPTALTVLVQDTGIGISGKDLPHIFERFYRTDKSRARQTGGSGIGLTIAKSIVEAHKGTLTVESELGRGSTFTVALPRSTGSNGCAV